MSTSEYLMSNEWMANESSSIANKQFMNCFRIANEWLHYVWTWTDMCLAMNWHACPKKQTPTPIKLWLALRGTFFVGLQDIIWQLLHLLSFPAQAPRYLNPMRESGELLHNRCALCICFHIQASSVQTQKISSTYEIILLFPLNSGSGPQALYFAVSWFLFMEFAHFKFTFLRLSVVIHKNMKVSCPCLVHRFCCLMSVLRRMTWGFTTRKTIRSHLFQAGHKFKLRMRIHNMHYLLRSML